VISSHLPDTEVPLPAHSVLAVALILLAVLCNLVYPGEVFPQSIFLLFLVSTLSCTIVILDQAGQSALPGVLRVAGETFLPVLCLLPSLFLSVNFSRSQKVWFLFFSYACLHFSLRTIKVNGSARLICVLFVSLAAMLIEIQALYQSAVGMEIMRGEITRLKGLDDSFRAALLSRIASGRVFANFPLPNTLAGFVAMVLPLNLLLIFLNVSRSFEPVPNRLLSRLIHSPLTRVVLSVQFIASLAVLFLTQSFGGWLACFGSLSGAGWVWLKRQEVRLRTAVMTILVLVLTAAVGMAWITLRRGFGLWELSVGENPIALRWNNYVTAWRIFRDFPVAGVGLGNYGTLNPRYQLSERFVTQYAHNTALQLLSECGVLFIVFSLILAAVFFSRRKSSLVLESSANWRPLYRICLLAGLFAWFIHNCLDIDLYFPSLGALGILMWGLYFESSSEPPPRRVPSRWERSALMLRRGTLAALFVVFFFGSCFHLSQMFGGLAADHALASDFESAKKYSSWAVRLNPSDAELVVLQSKIDVQASSPSSQTKRESLQTLRRGFEQASKLDRFNARYYLELSRIYSGLGEADRARKAMEHAKSLFPPEPGFSGDDSAKSK
jgi:O-antigen ligase